MVQDKYYDPNIISGPNRILPLKNLSLKEELQFVPGQMHNIQMVADRLRQNTGVDRLTQTTLDTESNLISKS